MVSVHQQLRCSQFSSRIVAKFSSCLLGSAVFFIIIFSRRTIHNQQTHPIYCDWFACDWFLLRLVCLRLVSLATGFSCDWFACDWFLLRLVSLATGLLATGFSCDWFACDWFLLRLVSLATGFLATGFSCDWFLCVLRLVHTNVCFLALPVLALSSLFLRAGSQPN
ncbi:phospholipid-transporting ATPase 9 [Dorcoceras hygrometricum]|uniref:Phospholipid-transporting ATPase 9 n=1 Tax=Dorcoceras hygrometricum TaxID=472368 RepID=A0A2Z7DDX1_9LAMI|nr:phospholipid-transporting ATPase 9 [Dorcoceras hygrometricum]